MTRRQWTAHANDVHIPAVDNRLCKCGKQIGEHDLGEDWILRADGCEGFEEEKKEVPSESGRIEAR